MDIFDLFLPIDINYAYFKRENYVVKPLETVIVFFSFLWLVTIVTLLNFHLIQFSILRFINAQSLE